MTTLTKTLGDIRYLKRNGGQLTGSILIPTPDANDSISPLGSVVNKQYINDNVPTLASTDARYAKLSGCTFTGNVSLTNDPTQSNHATTKQYVDSFALPTIETLTYTTPQITWQPKNNKTSILVLPNVPEIPSLTLSVDSLPFQGSISRLIIKNGFNVAHPFTWDPNVFIWPDAQPPLHTTNDTGLDLFTFLVAPIDDVNVRLWGIGQANYKS